MSVGSHLVAAHRVIIKIGSALLVDQKMGAVNRRWLAALASDVARFRARGQEVVIVSSGAIAVGRRHLGRFMERGIVHDARSRAPVSSLVDFPFKGK